MRLTAFILLLALVSSALAHGEGEHHHDEEEHVETGQHVTQLALLAGLEVLVKYQIPQPQKPQAIKVFVTDSVTNTPVAGLQIDVKLIDTYRAIAAEDLPGLYTATITFPAEDHYELQVKLTSQDKTIDGQVTFPAIKVLSTNKATTQLQPLPIVAALATLLVALFAATKLRKANV
ncbi:MAG: hypothetical protein RMM17_01410 [Acidobacteriota bacterium]|nr:hypothetical protein [Blastocatellia bacterium]MDW8411327.1 hypothetical protein [Acidobacteriota bacterium]